MKIASGDIEHFSPCQYKQVDNQRPRDLVRYLMPGFCLVSRQDLMKASMQTGKDAIDAMLDYLKVMTDIRADENQKLVKSKPYKKEKGWIVPIAIGYQGISDLVASKEVKKPVTNQRRIDLLKVL